jgi:hypothetical protein
MGVRPPMIPPRGDENADIKEFTGNGLLWKQGIG